MQSNNENNKFEYIYSAEEQAELRKIREKYVHKEEDKMERLRRLDKSVTNKAEAISLVFGVIGVLILGFGMSLIMTELHDTLGMGKILAVAVGLISGALGGVLSALAYPIYNIVIKRERARITPEIIRLTDELMK